MQNSTINSICIKREPAKSEQHGWSRARSCRIFARTVGLGIQTDRSTRWSSQLCKNTSCLILFKNGGNPNPNLCFTALSLLLMFDWGWNIFFFHCKWFEAAFLMKPMLLLCFLFFFLILILCPHYSSGGCVRPQFCVERLLWVSGKETDDNIYRDRVQCHQRQS